MKNENGFLCCFSVSFTRWQNPEFLKMRCLLQHFHWRQAQLETLKCLQLRLASSGGLAVAWTVTSSLLWMVVPWKKGGVKRTLCYHSPRVFPVFTGCLHFGSCKYYWHGEPPLPLACGQRFLAGRLICRGLGECILRRFPRKLTWKIRLLSFLFWVVNICPQLKFPAQRPRYSFNSVEYWYCACLCWA